MPADQSGTVLQYLKQGCEALLFEHTDIKDLVSDAGVDLRVILKNKKKIFFIEIRFVENDDCRNMIHFTGHQEPVDKTLRGPGFF